MSKTLPPEACAYIDAAVDAWDKKKSKLATKYLGRKISKELNTRGYINPSYYTGRTVGPPRR